MAYRLNSLAFAIMSRAPLLSFQTTSSRHFDLTFSGSLKTFQFAGGLKMGLKEHSVQERQRREANDVNKPGKIYKLCRTWIEARWQGGKANEGNSKGKWEKYYNFLLIILRLHHPRLAFHDIFFAIIFAFIRNAIALPDDSSAKRSNFQSLPRARRRLVDKGITEHFSSSVFSQPKLIILIKIVMPADNSSEKAL